jgi:hypothetical protein
MRNVKRSGINGQIADPELRHTQSNGMALPRLFASILGKVS